jgi:hypothetical protein
MEDPMHHNPVKLTLEGLFLLQRIIPHPVDTYIKIAGNEAAFGIIEGDDIRKVVVFKKTNIDVEEVGIGAEDKVKGTCFMLAGPYDFIQPFPENLLFQELKLGDFRMKLNR